MSGLTIHLILSITIGERQVHSRTAAAFTQLAEERFLGEMMQRKEKKKEKKKGNTSTEDLQCPATYILLIPQVRQYAHRQTLGCNTQHLFTLLRIRPVGT